MIGKTLVINFIPGMFIGAVYLSIILWQITGSTPIDLVNAITDTIVQPLQEVTKVFG